MVAQALVGGILCGPQPGFPGGPSRSDMGPGRSPAILSLSTGYPLLVYPPSVHQITHKQTRRRAAEAWHSSVIRSFKIVPSHCVRSGGNRGEALVANLFR